MPVVTAWPKHKAEIRDVRRLAYGQARQRQRGHSHGDLYLSLLERETARRWPPWERQDAGHFPYVMCDGWGGHLYAWGGSPKEVPH